MSEDAATTILEARATFHRLRGAAFDATEVLERIEGARRQMSVANDELRGQIGNTKDRVDWLIRELDKLNAQLDAFVK